MHPLKNVLKVQKIYIKQKKVSQNDIVTSHASWCLHLRAKGGSSLFFFKIKIRGRKKIREKMYLFNNVPLVDTNSLNIHAVLLNHFEIHLLVDIRNSNGNFLKNTHEWYYS